MTRTEQAQKIAEEISGIMRALAALTWKSGAAVGRIIPETKYPSFVIADHDDQTYIVEVRPVIKD